MHKSRISRTGTLPGYLITFCMFGFFLWAGLSGLENGLGWRLFGKNTAEQNEKRTVKNLCRIIRAQEVYFSRVPGPAQYAAYSRFVTHLWIHVDSNGTPHPIDLIPERLAMAMGRTRALDGYYLVDIHSRYHGRGKKAERLDYRRQWAVAAVPETFRDGGSPVFLSDHTGIIYAKRFKEPPSGYPANPPLHGWRLVHGPVKTEIQATK